MLMAGMYTHINHQSGMARGLLTHLITWVAIGFSLQACTGPTDSSPDSMDGQEGRVQITLRFDMVSSKYASVQAIDRIVAVVYDASGTEVIRDDFERVGERGRVSFSLTAGSGYRIEVSAFAGDEVRFYGSSAPIDIRANITTSVAIDMRLIEREETGPVTIDLDLAEGDQGDRHDSGLAPGDQVELQFNVRDVSAITGWEITVAFDPEMVRYVSGSFRVSSTFIPGLVPLVLKKYADAGEVGFGGVALGNATGGVGNGTIGQATFEIQSGFLGETEIAVTYVNLRPVEGEQLRYTIRSIATLSEEAAGSVVAPSQEDVSLYFYETFDSGEALDFSGYGEIVDVQGYAQLDAFEGKFLRNDSGPLALDSDVSRGEKTVLYFSGLPVHERLSIHFSLAIIDSWDGDDMFNVSVDGEIIFREKLAAHVDPENYSAPSGGQLVFGNGAGLYPELGFGAHREQAFAMQFDPAFNDISHSSQTVTIEWWADGAGWNGGDDESWGIDNVKVYLGADGSN